MPLKPTNDSSPRSFVGRMTTTRRSSKPKPKLPRRLERRERRLRGWSGSGGLRKLSRPRRRGGRRVSLLVVGIEAGTMEEKGVVGKGVERTKQRKTHRGVARRDVGGGVLNLPKRTDPTALPDVDLTRRTYPTVLPDATLILTTRRTNHTVLLDVPNAHIDPLHHTVAHIPLVLLLPPNHHPPLSHPKWTSILRNRTTPA